MINNTFLHQLRRVPAPKSFFGLAALPSVCGHMGRSVSALSSSHFLNSQLPISPACINPPHSRLSSLPSPFTEIH